jgi:hypothetical protein
MVDSKGWAMDSRSDGGPARKRREAMSASPTDDDAVRRVVWA